MNMLFKNFTKRLVYIVCWVGKVPTFRNWYHSLHISKFTWLYALIVRDNQFPCCFLLLSFIWKMGRGGNNKETSSQVVTGVEEITPEQSSLSLTTSLKLFITQMYKHNWASSDACVWDLD